MLHRWLGSLLCGVVLMWGCAREPQEGTNESLAQMPELPVESLRDAGASLAPSQDGDGALVSPGDAGAQGSVGLQDSGAPSVPADTSAAPVTVTWPSGTDGLDPLFFEDFGDWRGLRSTSSWINVHWLKWEWLTAPGLASTIDGENVVKVWDMLEGWDGLAVLSMSMAGHDDMTVEEYDEGLRQCAKGEFDDEWRTFAANATSQGRTGKNTVVSLAHEFNGTWFQWNPSNVGLDTWLGCWRHVYSAIKSASDVQVTWVFSATTHDVKAGDYSVASAWDAYPGDAYVDIIGINRYDFQDLGAKDLTDWKQTCGHPQDLCYAADFARKHGKKLGVPEWSVERGEFGYGDNPKFIEMMFKFFADNADILAFENNFNNGGLGDWHLYPASADNANAAARYKQLWSGKP